MINTLLPVWLFISVTAVCMSSALPKRSGCRRQRSERVPNPHKTPTFYFWPNHLTVGYTYANAGHSTLVYTTKGSDVGIRTIDCNDQSVGWKIEQGKVRKHRSTIIVTAWRLSPITWTASSKRSGTRDVPYIYAILYIHASTGR